jgi:hypothetical protein
MIETFQIVNAFSDALKSDQRAHVYSGRTPFGALLVKWSDKRVLIQAWDTTSPIGRKKLHSAIQRNATFKGYNVDAWIFIVHNLRQNALRLLDEYDVALVEITSQQDSAILLGTINIPDGMQSALVCAFEAKRISASFDFDGLVAPIGDPKDESVRTIATKSPRRTAFVSYSWDSDEHRRWVLKIAADLIRNGVNVKIDEWDLSDYGNDLHCFMEAGIRDSDFVIMVCTPNYAERANGRKGGVGVESSIITGEYYSPDNPKKYIPIVRTGKNTMSECLPSYLKSKLAITFSSDGSYENSFESLLRRIADIPRYKKPALGKFPNLTTDEI